METFFAPNLQFLRESKSWKKTDLAKRLKVDSTAIGKWEKGTGFPRVEKLLQLKTLFKIDLDKLFFSDFRENGVDKKSEYLRHIEVIGEQGFEIKILEKALSEITELMDSLIGSMEGTENEKAIEILDNYKEKKLRIDRQLSQL